MRLSPPWCLAVAAVVAGGWVNACGGPEALGGSGKTCFRDDDCDFGLVCAAPAGETDRVCTSDVSGLVSTVDAGLPQGGSAPTAGRAPEGGAPDGGTDAGGTGGSGGSGGTAAGSAGAQPSGGGNGGGSGAAGSGGASSGTGGT